MQTKIEGKVIVLGNNIDTDLIYPGRFLELTDHKEIGSHCLAGIDENIAKNFEKGSIIIAGENFGCGSSREHAAIAIINMGASVVLAESFARIFFRNGINLGLPLVVCKDISKKVKDGQTIAVDLEKATVEIKETKEILSTECLGDKALEILNAGGIKNLIRERNKK